MEPTLFLLALLGPPVMEKLYVLFRKTGGVLEPIEIYAIDTEGAKVMAAQRLGITDRLTIKRFRDAGGHSIVHKNKQVFPAPKKGRALTRVQRRILARR